MTSRKSDTATISKLLKDELGGLREAFGSLLAADRDKTAALEAHHTAYGAAAQRAELAEHRAERAELAVARLERDLAEARAAAAALARPGGLPSASGDKPEPEVAA